MEKEHHEVVTKLERGQKETISKMRNQHQNTVATMKNQHQEMVSKMENQHQDLVEKMAVKHREVVIKLEEEKEESVTTIRLLEERLANKVLLPPNSNIFSMLWFSLSSATVQSLVEVPFQQSFYLHQTTHSSSFSHCIGDG